MSYQVLARKWRPQDFAAIIGQEPIVTALRNALAEKRIAQAYVFSGIRGVGKTTAARVLAKALNCKIRRDGRGTDPCNDCGSCREITAGSDIDVIEVDAATYSKVEQVRELTESLRYAPANDRYKVVVLDEVHRLSRQAFDALLKIVEEPPPHLVFIFATTELDAVPTTILSRCQQFQFRRVGVSVLSSYLATLAERESITVSEATLRIIAHAGEGSVRDAVALLDQLATFGNGSVGDEDAARLIGGLDHGLLSKLFEAIVDGLPRDVRATVAEIDAVGLDPAGIYGYFVAYVRDALHLVLGGGEDTVDLLADETEALAILAKRAGYENLLRLLNLLLTSEDMVRRSDLGSLALEITWLRAAELPKLVAVETLLRGGIPMPPATQTDPVEPSPTQRSGARAPEPSEKRALRPNPRPEADPATAILKAVRISRPPLAVHLRNAASLTVDRRVLTIAVVSDDQLLEQALSREANGRALENAVHTVLGDGARWCLERVPSGKAASSQARPPRATPLDPLPPPTVDPTDGAPRTRAPKATRTVTPEAGDREEDRPPRDQPIVRAVLDLFDGATVESRGPLGT